MLFRSKSFSQALCAYLVLYPFARYIINNIKAEPGTGDFEKIKASSLSLIDSLDLSTHFNKASRNIRHNLPKEDPTEPLLKTAISSAGIYFARKVFYETIVSSRLRKSSLGKVVDLSLQLAPLVYFGSEYLGKLVKDPSSSV